KGAIGSGRRARVAGEALLRQESGDIAGAEETGEPAAGPWLVPPPGRCASLTPLEQGPVGGVI
ncbi:hypothetical protein, partial [Pseudoclavibacter helvolus]|uniref:hypothetical protein n=1 Tax=Pseudoclavibacter helvolus TaxID=255205 RepID=UPI000B0C244D